MPDNPGTDRIKLWRAMRAQAAKNSNAEKHGVPAALPNDIESRSHQPSEETLAENQIEQDAVVRAQRQMEIVKTSVAPAPQSKTPSSQDDDLNGPLNAYLPGEDDVNRVRREILEKQKKTRRLALVQAFIFTILPTLFVAYYVTYIAVPLYEARSVVAITKPGSPNDQALPGMLGSVLPQTNLNEAFMAMEYILSPEMMRILEDELRLSDIFGSAAMDPLSRMRDIGALQISSVAFFNRYVKAAVNIQTGLLTLYVRGRSREEARALSLAILGHAETHIGQLSAELFQAQIENNEHALLSARTGLENAKAVLTGIRLNSGYSDPRESVRAVYVAIGILEQEIAVVQGKIDETALLGYSESTQMSQLQSTKAALETRIVEQRNRLSDTSNGRSLNDVLADYEFAIVQLEIAEQIWATALSSLESSRNAAALGQSRFQIVVPPNASSIASYPNRINTTILAFILFFGLFSIVRVFRTKLY